METLRSFIAIELPAPLQHGLGQIAAKLRAAAPDGVKWVAPQSVHLTLKFLGDIPVGRVPDVTAGLKRAAAGIAPFTISLGRPGAFPDTRAPRVVWVGLEGELAPLLDLARQVAGEMAALGFPPEARPFAPHLTLGRVRDMLRPAEREALGRSVAAAGAAAGSCRVSAVSLMRSTLTPQGALYNRLAGAPLAPAT